MSKPDELEALRNVAIAAIRLRFAFPPDHYFDCSQCQQYMALFDALDTIGSIDEQKQLAAPVKRWEQVDGKWRIVPALSAARGAK